MCERDLPEEAFYVDNSRGNRGYSYRCRECTRKKSAEWAAANPERNRELHRGYSRKYRAKKMGYEQLDLDNGQCQICGYRGSEDNVLVTDHDHKSGTTRDVLCRRCNLAIGNFEDDPARLGAAAMYLRKHGRE
jgi:hypothetical protein